MRVWFVMTVGVTGAQRAEFCIFCSHLSDFQVTSSIISSPNAASVVYYRYQFVVSISLTTFRIRKFSWRKNWPIVPRYRGTMGHWVGHNKYIETLQILLHLIFIYLILQININILSDLKQNSCFSCTVCATTDSRGRQNKMHITRFNGVIIITV